MNTIDTSHIRNFSIVAHIDHGKSTISDRILELTRTVEERDMASQLLDTMDIERERGITIKSNAVRVMYDADDGETYQFNLIDTPGHVDFTYEVSRSLAACEGAVLVVDATQGVEAQTVSNASLAMNADLDIVPAINKIDLPSAHPEEVKGEIEDELAIPADDAVCVSGKTGEGIHDLLEAIVFLVSPPRGDADEPLKALILDSYFDEYRGVVATVRVFDGCIKKGQSLRMMQGGEDFLVDGVGVKRPAETPVDAIGVGEVGFVVTGLKDPEAVHVGDTLTDAACPCAEPLPGYREAKPMVYTGLFPIDNKDYENLRDALEKLHVNDPSLVWSPETSVALGFGFRVGFLGLLHMEVVKERLEREFGLALIATSPSVDYHVYKTDGEMVCVRSPQDLPAVSYTHLGEVLCEAFPDKKVQMHGPDVTVHVLVVQGSVYVYAKSEPGVGGLPQGSAGKVVTLLSSGIDSPVATWMLARRGAVPVPVHFSGRPQTADTSEYLTQDIVRALAPSVQIGRLYVVPFGDCQREISLACPGKLRVIMYRRVMYAVAERIARMEGAKAIVTGESLGQVASQTLENIMAVNEVVDLPVFRPLIGSDKQEIIVRSQQIGTYDISCETAPDCCTLFMPRRPETHAKLDEVRSAWEMFDHEAMIERLLDEVEYIDFDHVCYKPPRFLRARHDELAPRSVIPDREVLRSASPSDSVSDEETPL